MQHKITLEPSGRSFTALAEETVLDAAIRQNIPMNYGCRSGLCGKCMGKLVTGEIGYDQEQRPPLLDSEPSDACLPCQAFARSDLVLKAELLDQADDIQVRTMPCKLARKVQLNHDVVQLFLQLPEGERIRYRAGQYLDFLLPDGQKRAFSIANAPDQDDLIELHIRHVPGGSFTGVLFDQAREKDIFRIEAPLGQFYLREDFDRPLIFIAGGTGMAPIKGMLEQLAGMASDRRIHLYWGVRSLADQYLPDLAKTFAERLPHLDYQLVLSEAESDWQGRRGFVHQAVCADHADLSGFDVYMAGPPVMINAAAEAMQRQGARSDRMFSDAFEYAKPKAAAQGA